MTKLKGYILKLGVITSVIVIAALFYLFDSFVSKIATESLSNWLKVEEATILEGNLLTSVTKNQRAVHSSEFLKGFMLADFSKIGQIEQISSGDPIDPSLVKVENLENNKIEIIRTGLFKKYAAAIIPNSESKVIIFSFWSEDIYKIFLYSCSLILAIILFFGYLLAKAKKRENEKSLLYAEQAARVAHDIRSPLVQLSASIEKIEDPITKGQLSEGLQRAVDILNDLVLNKKKAIQKEKTQNIVRIVSLKESIESLVDAKREIYPHIKFQLQDRSKGVPISLDQSDLMRSFSNLIENSVEACSKDGIINVAVEDEAESLKIIIQDNGKGIPKEILPSIGMKGATYGKEHGSGLGIYYAQLSLANAGGSLQIESEEEKGTKISIQIPFRKTRVVSNKEIRIEYGSYLLILDDDPLIRKSWAQILSQRKIDEKLEVRYFSSTKEILISKIDLCKAFLFTDYDLKEEYDGLDIVGRLKMYDRSLLVTGMASNSRVQTKAQNMGNVPILSKENLMNLHITII